jgi:hypothetical protein
MNSTIKLKLGNLIRRLINEESDRPAYVVSCEAKDGTAANSIGRNRYTNFNAALGVAETWKSGPKFNKDIGYLGVQPISHGDKFAVLYCTPEWFRRESELDNPEDTKAFRTALLKCMKTGTTQIGVFPSSTD